MAISPKKSKRFWWIFKAASPLVVLGFALVVALLAVAGIVSLISLSTFGDPSTAAETADTSGGEAACVV